MPEDYSLAEIAAFLGAELRGDGALRISGLNTLKDAGPGELAFLANEKYASQLGSCNAAAVIMAAKHMATNQGSELVQYSGTALVLENPYLGYARISQWFDRCPKSVAGVHPSAVIADSASLGAGVTISANVVVEADAVIGSGSYLGAGSFIGARSQLGDNARISANVSIYHDVVLGSDVVIHSGSVIGADGFGFAPDGAGQWQKIYQIGGVKIGNSVEIGACSTIDRGALGDTCIGDHVIIDNHVQIAHNAVIGNGCALAAYSGLAGSATLGNNCILAGDACVVGHVTICDNVQVTARGLVTKSITEPGSYSSGMPLMKTREWRKNAVRITQLDSIARRLKDFEKD
ncbi:MAG: UDP-3-O-(3-hydroxymyristoyl)glucosamine N-acyltransferase [Porticoccaceae bacterium]|jgi:UDP-3-O-[3-hydroxymyristoyl] glucosamine N-acyltransferase|nr:UDP-3-O-(3-hydroxymyristoyl)glucosamine N-acyltransferase [Porticoccaceae bacterium]MBT6592951.1 UDP-3-O-(3-hydroxymyristoyl)glucosamine N-acyltransferase [Porticoccaceae bacterium]MDG1079675.1 UDP-3-O-(3-hydroxymyristoyl)glucosamine N-acyltransferase [Porticoccaceae bacterium]